MTDAEKLHEARRLIMEVEETYGEDAPDNLRSARLGLENVLTDEMDEYVENTYIV